jgi:glycine/D-amino acid oxidase-like deaminating enzyme
MSLFERSGGISFWYADIGGLPKRRDPLDGDAVADVCIIGGGYTGLWTAYYLKKAKPALSVIVVEREFAGFGASGRNGGWITGGFAWNHQRYLDNGDAAGVRNLVQALAGSVDEIITVAAKESIEADIVRTRELMVATNPAQLERARREVEQRRFWGEAEDRIWLAGEAETRATIAIPGALGGLFVGNVARAQPAKLVQGLARVVERLGVRIVEDTAVIAISPGRVMTARGEVRAGAILRATEGCTAGFAGHRRDLLPLNSAQIVTEPLSGSFWKEIGWRGHELFGDMANVYCYCQRTREGRIAVGSRGVPYRLGSRTDVDGQPDSETVRRLIKILHRHFPAARSAHIDHAWCGVLGVPRDWCATVGFDRQTGLGFAGGYVGTGVATSNLAGRTLADLALGRDSALTRLPWVNRRMRKWEKEPVRYLAVNAMYGLLNLADRREAVRRGPPSRIAGFANRLAGR